jgi:hypothetical protein
VVKLPKNFDEKKELSEYLSKKHLWKKSLLIPISLLT